VVWDFVLIGWGDCFLFRVFFFLGELPINVLWLSIVGICEDVMIINGTGEFFGYLCWLGLSFILRLLMIFFFFLK